MTDADAPTLRPKRYAIKFNPPRFVLEYTDGVKTRTRSVRRSDDRSDRSVREDARRRPRDRRAPRRAAPPVAPPSL
jgi:hypothetical protein|tara:strand:- start:589 stop:816 length:228 start_codon:yes stop_codon:yes gene_type:complete